MCGIIFSNNPKVMKSRFVQALGLLSHRGPDSPGNYLEIKNNKFGHARLKILDLSNDSNQPFISRNQRYVIIYNGEVYNFKELSSKYKLKLNTTCDTEVLLELYSLLGLQVLNELNGMFAFVIYDKLTNEYLIARDRLGIKPLYFSWSGEFINVSSELAALVELNDKAVEFDEIGIRQYRKLRTFFNGKTIFRNISMLLPGHYLKGRCLKKYWELPEGAKEPPSDEELKWLVESSVSYRSISDVPLGSYLSGGLDSTIVALLAREPHTWTIGFENQNEFYWARLAADKKGSIHHEILIDNNEFHNLTKKMISSRLEPLSVPNEVLLYKMTKNVKQFNTVVLSGEGADELFFGYDRIFKWANMSSWNIYEFDKLYSYGSHPDFEIIEDVMEPYSHYKDNVSRIAAFFQTAHLHGLLRRLDNSTMMCSVEARVPFVDHRLVERMAGVPFDYRLKNNVIKAPLKRIFKDLVPDQIITREKIGFPVPLKDIYNCTDNVKNPMDKWIELNLGILENEINKGLKRHNN